MTRVVLAGVIEVALAICVCETVAHADDPCTTDCRVSRARALLEKGDAKAARSELKTAYKLDPRPDLLFALGQVELNLGNFQVAIEYYEKFIATDPSAEQVSLAEQAIGAARMRLAQPQEPPPPPPPAPIKDVPVVRHRHWDLENTGIVALGGLAVLGGAGLIVYAQRQSTDQSGSLSEYDDRLHDARITRWTGIGVASAGALAVGAAIVRWRLSGRAEVSVALSPAGTASVWGRW
jgi:tetratricopeptide (TPR) repeat protein